METFLTVNLSGFLDGSHLHVRSALGTLPILMKFKRVTCQKAKIQDLDQQEIDRGLIMCEMTKCFLERHEAQIFTENYCQCLHYYLEGVLDLIIREAGEGSLQIVVQCKTLKILECLWEDYSSSHLNEVAEAHL